METGDLCADTAPTPKSKACRDPGVVKDSCGLTMYHDTPYSNYMSYTGTLDNTITVTASVLLENNRKITKIIIDPQNKYNVHCTEKQGHKVDTVLKK